MYFFFFLLVCWQLRKLSRTSEQCLNVFESRGMHKSDWKNGVIFLTNSSMAGWKIFNSPPTQHSINLVGQLKILMVSTWQIKWVGQVDKFNWLNKIILIKLNNCLLPQMRKNKVRKEKFSIFIKNNYKYYIIFIRMAEMLSHWKEKYIKI